jgi:RNA polymerase sigma factor (sigma-70 family)
MEALDDIALLREYAASNSETAFETLVTRRVGFVYSAALRQVRDPHLAEEVTQAVFIILAQKAGRIPETAILTGWLFKTTRFVALAQTRSAAKRRQREQDAHMQTELEPAAPDLLWEQMAPMLDEALASLSERDRQAILLRFFEGKSLAEVGNTLKTGEDTARKRVTRALEKLRKHFSRRGVASTSAIIAAGISANSVHSAPVALAKSATTAAIAKGAAASGSTLTLIKGALKLMAWTKAKIAIAVGLTVLLTAGTTTVIVRKARNHIPDFNALAASKDFWVTRLPTGMPIGMLNNFGNDPDSYSYPGEGARRCSISGLLNQCMETEGFKYVIDIDVSAGSVVFGSTNTLNGSQWVAAFEKALQTGKPEWWDFSRGKGFRRKENLVLLKFPRQKIVLVLPKDKAGRFE